MTKPRPTVEEYVAAIDRIVAPLGKRRAAVIEGHIARCYRWERELEAWAMRDDGSPCPCPYDAFQLARIRNALFSRLMMAA